MCAFHSGAYIEAQDDNSYTLLMTAVAHEQKEAMDELISMGAKVEKFDREGKSIIFLAVEYNRVAVLKVTVLIALLRFVFSMSLPIAFRHSY